MFLKFLKLLKRVFLVCFETLAVLLGFVVLLGGLLVWQLTHDGIDVTFAKNYVQERIASVNDEYTVDLAKVAIKWPDIHGPFLLDLQEVSLTQNQDKLLSVESVQVGVYVRSLLVGAVRPSTVIFDNLVLRLVRDEQGSVTFNASHSDKDITADNDAEDISDEDGVQLLEISDGGENILSRYLDQFITEQSSEDGAEYLKFVSKLQSIEITNSRLYVDDRQLGNSWMLKPFSIVFDRKKDGVVVKINVEGGDLLSEGAKLSAELSYNMEEKTFDVLTDIHHFDPMDLSQHFGGFKSGDLHGLEKNEIRLSMQASARLAADFTLLNSAFSVSARDARLWIEGVYDRYLNLNDLYVQGRYDPVKHAVVFDDSFIKIEGVKTNIETVLPLGMISADKATDYKIPVRIHIPRLEQTQIEPLWPSMLDGEGSKQWATERFSKGYFENIEIDMPLAVKQSETIDSGTGEKSLDRSFEIQNTEINFGIKNMTIDYREPLAPIERANGSGNFSSESDALTLEVEDAQVLDMQASNGKAVLTNIIAGQGNAQINVDLEGPLPTVFEYIAVEPISIDENTLGIDVDQVRGIAKVQADISFPTVRDVKAEEVKVKVAGTLEDLLLPGVVRGLDVSGGPYNFSAADGAIQVKGSGFLSGRSITFDYIQNLETEGKPYSSKVSAKFTSDPVLRRDLGVNLSEYIKGQVPLDIEFTRYDEKRAEILFNANLKQAVLEVDDFDYSKKIGVPGRANGSIVIEGEYIKEVRDINISADDFYIDKGRLLFHVKNGESDIYKGSLPVLRIYETNVAAEFEIDHANVLRVQANGEFLDARPFMGGQDEKGVGDSKASAAKNQDDNGVIAFVDVERMRTSDTHMVQNAKLYVDVDKAKELQQFELDALAGQGKVYLRMKPGDDGRMTLRLETDDAGAMLHAFDTYEKMRGGKLALYAESKSVDTNNELHGHVQIKDFKVIDAPILGRILSMAGPAAIPAMLKSDGMNFSRLESDFSWRRSNSKDFYMFKDGKASASSLRLTFDGVVDELKDRWDVSGTIVPLSALNSLISNIPLVGDILAGGKDGAVLAATYTVKGKANDPQVSVNPLAALAPGILRKMIFEDERKGSLDDDSKKAPDKTPSELRE